MPKWNVSKEILDILNERIPNSWDLHLMSNNPTAEIAAERHENTHFVHDARGQIDEDSRLYQTADMKVEKDYVTEKLLTRCNVLPWPIFGETAKLPEWKQ